MKPTEKLFEEIKELANNLNNQGWSEKNAGNFSIRMEKSLRPVHSFPHEMEQVVPHLGDQTLLCSVSGSRMPDIYKIPEQNICYVTFNHEGNSYAVTNANKTAIRDKSPTSELSTHALIHDTLIANKKDERVVLHSHPTEIIALTQIPLFKSEETINELLTGMHPESSLFIPEGIGFVPYQITGSDQLATLSMEKIGSHRTLIWEKHGSLSIGKNLTEAFDLLTIVSKCASIFFMVRQAGYEPEGLSKDQLEELRKIQWKYKNI